MTALAHNLATLRPPGSPDDFVLVERPVFSEHWTREERDSSGNVTSERTYIGREELEQIVDRCNERILDTNDFSPIVVQHTIDKSHFDPELVGFCGPFYMGTVGKLNPKAAIYAKTWVYKEKKGVMRSHPRLSVEYWCSAANPSDGYFDPISLLGARTPELDLGIHYQSKPDSDKKLVRYSQTQAAYPGGANTSVPALVNDEDKREYSKEPDGMFTAESIQQLVAALTPVIKQQVADEMSSMKAAMTGGGEPEEDDDADDLDLDNDTDLDVDDSLDGLDDEQPDENGDDAEGDETDEGLPEIADEANNEQPGGDVAESDEDDSETTDASNEDEDEEKMPPEAPAKPATPAKPKKPEQFARQPGGEMTLQQYAKENADLRQKYEKAETRAKQAEERLTTVESEIGDIKRDKVRAVRYSKLSDLRSEGFVIDVDQELTDVKEFTDAQFDRHCTKIVERYQRAPIGHSIPVPAAEKHVVEQQETRVRYSKTARQVCEEAAKTNKHLDYGSVLANVERNKGQYVAV